MLRSAEAFLTVQVSSSHLAMPDHNDVGQVLLMTAVALLLVGWGLSALRRVNLRSRYESVRGLMVGTIGEGTGGKPLAVIEYEAAGRRYRLPALIPRARPWRPPEPLTVFYDRSDPTVAQLAYPSTAGRYLLFAAVAVLAVGALLVV